MIEPHALRARLATLPPRPPGPNGADPRTIAPAMVAAPAATEAGAALAPSAPIPAAVLVPILTGPSPSILLTKRTPHLSSHAGQVSFPGGRIDPDDVSPEAAALREAHEEIGLDPDQVELLGRLPDYTTGTGFRVTPVVGLLPPDPDLSPSPHEVAALLHLPLSVLLNPEAPQRRRSFVRGSWREFWVWPHPEHEIWGATAAILVALAAVLRDPD